MLAAGASLTAVLVSSTLVLLRWKFSIDVIKFKAAIDRSLKRLFTETAKKLKESSGETDEALSEAVSKVGELNLLKTRLDSFTNLLLIALTASIIGFPLFVFSLLSDPSVSADLSVYYGLAYFFGGLFMIIGLWTGRDLAAKYESLMVSAIEREGDALQEVRDLERRVSRIEKDRKT